VAGAAALVHAVLPFAFETTASRAVRGMNEIIVRAQRGALTVSRQVRDPEGVVRRERSGRNVLAKSRASGRAPDAQSRAAGKAGPGSKSNNS